MKSFDRRSFGKLLLGAIPAVFLAKKATAETARGFTKADVKRWAAELDAVSEKGEFISFPAHCGNNVMKTYSCGHSVVCRFTVGDPAGMAVVLPSDPRPSVVYEINKPWPCADCDYKQQAQAEAWLNENSKIPFNRKEFANTLTQFLEDPRVIKQLHDKGLRPDKEALRSFLSPYPA